MEDADSSSSEGSVDVSVTKPKKVTLKELDAHSDMGSLPDIPSGIEQKSSMKKIASAALSVELEDKNTLGGRGRARSVTFSDADDVRMITGTSHVKSITIVMFSIG